MAEIRVEQKSGGRGWIWVVLVLLVLIAAALLLDRAGYVDLPVNVGGADAQSDAPAALVLESRGHLQEA